MTPMGPSRRRILPAASAAAALSFFSSAMTLIATETGARAYLALAGLTLGMVIAWADEARHVDRRLREDSLRHLLQRESFGGWRKHE